MQSIDFSCVTHTHKVQVARFAVGKSHARTGEGEIAFVRSAVGFRSCIPLQTPGFRHPAYNDVLFLSNRRDRIRRDLFGLYVLRLYGPNPAEQSYGAD